MKPEDIYNMRLIFDYMGMQSQLSLPQNFSEIFETLMFQTKKENSKIMVPLSQRGDGIQARHIPIILKYIADEDKLGKILENPQVIKTPVVRNGKQSTLGYQPDVWKAWK